MIRYALKCSAGHSFESWFQSAAAYEKLAASGLVACAVCGGARVEKALMTPGIGASASGPDRAGAPDEGTPPPGPLSGPRSPAEQALAELKHRIETQSEYVGPRFAAEARAIHEGAAPERAIHGEARLDDARKLLADGVPVAPLPFRPDRRNN